FGRAAALRAAEIVKPNTPHQPLGKDDGQMGVERLERLRNSKGSIKTGEIRLDMQRLMQLECAVFRNENTLIKGVEDLKPIAVKLQDIQVNDKSMIWNTDLMEALELENLILQAQVTLHSALNRKESRGAHA